MSSTGAGQGACGGEAKARDTTGQFALVAYIPDPLARFLDDLRIELTPGSKPRAHVTILPPRPVSMPDQGEAMIQPVIQPVIEAAIGCLAATGRAFRPFRIEIGDIGIFAASQVVYLGLARGNEDLACLYRALNCGSLQFSESFPYHPHVTIAQHIESDDALEIATRARESWWNYAGPRGFTVERLSFVQNVAPSVWIDIATIELALAPGI